MRRMIRFISLVLACWMLTAAARAAQAAPWVNFCPAEWDRAETVRALSRTLAETAGDRRALPQAVHDWMCENLYFDEDAFRDGTYQELAANEVLRSRKGVCESFANLVQSLLLEAGIPCVKVWGCAIPEGTAWEDAEIDPGRVNHTWNAFYMDGKWVSMDCTMDMGNRYEAGAYLPGAWKSDFYAPEERLLAQTHRVIQFGSDLPEQIPDGWARAEIEEAAAKALLPAGAFRDYRAPLSEREFRAMLRMDGGTDAPLTRAGTAVLLAAGLGEGCAASGSYQDMEGCTGAERQAAAALAQARIMQGTGGTSFSPGAVLTRQEAIVLAVRLNREGL